MKKNWPAGPVQVITRIPKLRVPAPAAPGPLSDGTWIVATSPALPMSMPHTRSRYSVLAAALFTRRSPLPSPHAADDLHNWTICVRHEAHCYIARVAGMDWRRCLWI